MINNVVLVSGIQKSDSVIHIHVSSNDQCLCLLFISSDWPGLMLNPSREFFSFDIIFFNSRISVWFFFIVSVSLLMFLILFIYCFPNFV